MIIKAPINLELTQTSGQTSQPPWKQSRDVFSNVVMVDAKPVLFNVRQSGKSLDFDFSGEIPDKKAVSTLSYIYDLDFDLDKFYRYLSNQPELSEMSKFCEGLRLFLAPDYFECVISSICSAKLLIRLIIEIIAHSPDEILGLGSIFKKSTPSYSISCALSNSINGESAAGFENE